MPLYEYRCGEDGVFEEQRPLSEFSSPAKCPTCGTPSPRILSAPRLAAMPRSTVMAHERNERSAHEPKIVAAADRGASSRARAASLVGGSGGRPWSLGHG